MRDLEDHYNITGQNTLMKQEIKKIINTVTAKCAVFTLLGILLSN